MKIHPIQTHNALRNVFYILEYADGKAIVIDPCDSNLCNDFLQKHSLTLEKIYITHRHPDHYSGVPGLNCSEIYASQIDAEKIPFDILNIVQEGDVIFDEDGSIITVMETPGHTQGHISFELSSDGGVIAIFVGDTVFSGGVGHVRGGDVELLYESVQKFQRYEDNVTLYSGHDYLENNYDFILSLDVSKKELIEEIYEKKGDGVYFTNLGDERKINLFFSADKEQFIELRNKRNNW